MVTTRERIIQAARELFFKHGVRNVTMSDIALDLGMSKRTIYENIKDKDQLIAECIEQFETSTDLKYDKLDPDMKMITLIELLIKHATEIIESDFGVFMGEVKKYHPAVFVSAAEKHREKRQAQTDMIIKKGVSEGFFLKNVDVNLLSILFSNVYTIFEKNEVHTISKEQIPAVFKSVMILFCRGMATLKGINEIDRVFAKR